VRRYPENRVESNVCQRVCGPMVMTPAPASADTAAHTHRFVFERFVAYMSGSYAHQPWPVRDRPPTSSSPTVDASRTVAERLRCGMRTRMARTPDLLAD
jgi:hypothetical protein